MKTLFKVTLLLLITCFISSAFAQDDMEKIKQTLQDLNEKFSQAMIDRNSEMMLDYYTDDAISMPSYSPMMVGKEAIQKGMEMDKEAKYKVKKFKLINTNVITSGDLVCDIGTYEMEMEMEGMDSPVTDEGKYLTVYQKQSDGSLKIKAEIWNSNNNPWMRDN